MARKVFYSFHYDADASRAAQVRNMGLFDGNVPCSSNEWEAVLRGGEAAIRRWIDGQLRGTSCTVVLIGSDTAGRKWIDYEIGESWDRGNGLVGIHIHGLRNLSREQSAAGENPFDGLTTDDDHDLGSIVQVYDPQGWDSKDVYATIKDNIADWIEEAIDIRGSYD